METRTERLPLNLGLAPGPVPEQHFTSPTVLTTDRLIEWLKGEFGPETAEKMQKVLASTDMPDWNHVCWTLAQDDDMARAMNNVWAWIRQASAYIERAEAENQKALNGPSAKPDDRSAQ